MIVRAGEPVHACEALAAGLRTQVDSGRAGADARGEQVVSVAGGVRLMTTIQELVVQWGVGRELAEGCQRTPPF